ncbi:tRNA pseudouridine55 synthase [Elusimicrobium posterum]|uniref:tRNA pseudouridine(55) synthase TruB n=1 Tax=Elusimicrobium posterum TaxID=3116653 RepID=UPI003C73B205
MQNEETPSKAGILLIDKPSDWTSHDIINVARTCLGIRKIGHSGTLDPLATGLLVLLVGRAATKLQDQYLKLPKTYQAKALLGEETDTWDAHGEIINTAPIPDITQEDILKAAEEMTGTFEHTVPVYSAKKFNGLPMYKLAREGREVTEKTAKITVYKWADVSYEKPYINFTVTCSSGTYVRSLAHTLAKKLGSCAHLAGLRRTEVGGFDIKEAITVEQLRTLPQEILFDKIKEV